MRRLLAAGATLATLIPSFALATLIEFQPGDVTADLGETIALDIVATPETGELIGAFDFIVNVDPAVLAISNVVFGNSLNDDPLFCNLLVCRGAFGTGTGVNLSEFSLALSLSSLQDGQSPVTLATLFLTAIGVGTSDLTFSGNILGQFPPFDFLGDEFGSPLPVFKPGTGSVTIVAVPEPPSLLLMFAGLLILSAIRRWRRTTA